MNFLNGMWRVKENVQIHRAKQAYEIEVHADSVRITAPSKVIRSRGDTLNLPVLDIELTSPIDDVICVNINHFKGSVQRGPCHDLSPGKADIQITQTEREVIFRSNKTSARISKDEPFHIDYYYGEKLLTSTGDSLTGPAYVVDSDGQPYMREMLNLGVGEYVYGLGERFGPFVKNGQNVDIWAEDGGTCTQIAYKNVPLYLSNRCYGVFVNDTGRISYEIASEVVSKVQFTVPGHNLQYLVIGGETMHKVMEAYTALTGRPAALPAWSFGLWLSTSFTTSYDEQTVNEFIDGMAERDIPLQVFHYDCFWMREFRWCDFTFDKRMFPDPAGMLARLKQKGLKICVWINPYIAQRSELFDEGMKGGYLLKRPNGDIWQWDLWQAGMACVDFTNPGAVKWYQDKLRALLDMGVDCFKTDFGERIPTEVVYHDGSDPIRMHNYYTYLYNKAVFELLEEYHGKGSAVLFARSGIAGGQKFPLHWGGDCSGSFESMAETMRGGLSLSMSGYSFWSHDIGGFENTAAPDLYKRWCAFGLLSTHSRLHGSDSYRVPWNFDEEAVDVLRYFTKLKCRMMPYLFSASCNAGKTGVPVMRAMVMDYPEDMACAFLDCQYKLGDNLIVAPVLRDDGTADFYLPDGRWTSLIDSRVYEGGRWYREKYDYFALGLFAAQNSILPMGNTDNSTCYDYLDGISYHIFETTDGARFSCGVYDQNGTLAENVSAYRNGDTITVTVENAPCEWEVNIKGIAAKAQKGVRSVTVHITNI